MKNFTILSFLATSLFATPLIAKEQAHFSLFGTVKYKENFTHFDYVNPDAPKGGKVFLSGLGTFDSFNPFIVRGNPEQHIGYCFATLMTSSHDEVGVTYPYVADSIYVDPNREYVVFNLNPKACFHNNDLVTTEDIIFSFNSLKKEGSPFYRSYYKNIVKVEATGPHQIKFIFDKQFNPELPLILAQLPVLSKKFYTKEPFKDPRLAPPLCSGPYYIDSFKAGDHTTYTRNKNWWGKDLPSFKGYYNFDEVKVTYFRDFNALFEAFKGGQLDVRQEMISRLWKTGYDFHAVKDKMVIMDSIPFDRPQTYGLFFNTRTQNFSDVRIRKALTILFNFEWMNKHLFYDMYHRVSSYFAHPDIGAVGKPTQEEIAVLSEFKDQLPAEVLTEEFTYPSLKTADDIRKVYQQAKALFEQAGWVIKDQKMISKKSGKQFSFEIVIPDKSFEKIMLTFASSLEKVGIKIKIKLVDRTNYQQLVDDYKFDMILDGIGQSHTPGNEQREFWHSSTAQNKGGKNYAGIKNPVVDKLIEKIISAKDYKSLQTYTKSLDRVLLWNYYMIPSWESSSLKIAYWDRFMRPKILAKYNPLNLSTWWIDKGKDKAVEEYKNGRSSFSIPLRKYWNSLLNLLGIGQ